MKYFEKVLLFIFEKSVHILFATLLIHREITYTSAI